GLGAGHRQVAFQCVRVGRFREAGHARLSALASRSPHFRLERGQFTNSTIAWTEPSRAIAPGRNMSRLYLGMVVGIGMCVLTPCRGFSGEADDKPPVVVLETSLGKITIELDKEKAPITAENFLKYVDAGFYDNLVFHRVMSNFMIQGGGF